LQLWRQHKTGPPVTYVGRVPFYRIQSARAWLRREEVAMVREGQRRSRP
jgi:hypothetical protein